MKKSLRKSEQGQALVEYVLLIAMIAGMVFVLSNQMPALFTSLETGLRKDFKYIYQFGDAKARGADDEEAGPKRHVRIYKADNFRLFGRGT